MIILSRSTVENFLVIGKKKMEKKSFITREVCQLILIDSSLSIIYLRIFKFFAQSVMLEIIYFYSIFTDYIYGLNFIRDFYFNSVNSPSLVRYEARILGGEKLRNSRRSRSWDRRNGNRRDSTSSFRSAHSR